MTEIPLTICIGILSAPLATLTPELWQLTHQTVDPVEILVISASPDDEFRAAVREACAEFAPLVRVIDAPQYNNPTDDYFGYTYNSSHSFNVGIKQSSPRSKFICLLGAGLLLSKTSLEGLGEMMSPGALCEAQMALLPAEYEIGEVETLWNRWDDLVEHLDAFSRSISFATGSLMCTTRDWFFKVHGLDEINYPLSYNDSDLHRRARLDGLVTKIVPWGKMQMVHVMHERRYQLAPYPDGRETNIIANGEYWGEIEEKV